MRSISEVPETFHENRLLIQALRRRVASDADQAAAAWRRRESDLSELLPRNPSPSSNASSPAAGGTAKPLIFASYATDGEMKGSQPGFAGKHS